MVQPGMRITVNAAMRARDISRPRPGGEEPPAAAPAAGQAPGQGAGKPGEPAKRTRAAKNERRRLGKRGGARKPPENGL
ncbi:hypothetical protein E1293_12030 [Actinomadura darangshiensis]|uniref:Uncharacterized protein n=1 Tax=Actinomadura darangshiensis TaxID=705336 RepID=A0A4R5BH05_9ACTN|nr:hypothetical protein [Actinomadura darangshiensis]TDD85005.1 hypothetical protein E1293_12030 [Actinomadura darangshiensis]